MEELAKQICKYNGQRGTEKQVSKCKHAFMYDINIMKQFMKNRIK